MAAAESPLQHAVGGVYVDERSLADEIGGLWLARQTYNAAIRSEKPHVRSLEAELAEMLYTMKALLSQAGRNGDWSEFLRERGIPPASAERLVAGFQRKLGKDDCFGHANAEPTVNRSELAGAAGAGHEFHDGGNLVLSSPRKVTDGTPGTLRPMGIDFEEWLGALSALPPNVDGRAPI
jgi:hypothetical protein